jgi:hypothetical protein
VPITVRELKDVRPPLLWEPKEGGETTRFVERKHTQAGIPKSALENVVFEARQILGRCLDPTGPVGKRTGLVVGYVQSGKTLSFTTLTALAHDNGFALIVLIAGTLENLKQQTLDRLTSDLELSSTGVTRPWLLVHQPSENTSDAALLRQHLKNWTDPSYPQHKKRVCVAVVLKHPKRIANLRDCLKGLELAKIPTLVIDDEADQASLNTFAASNQAKGTNRASANYREVLALKQVFPHHTYVQYTATPQANLLISLVDHLSPEFAELVSPGTGYVGGATLFKPKGGYAKTIPDSDASAKLSTSSAPPASLVNALRTYLLAACASEVKREGANRTMMVHPSQQTGPHNDYLHWIDELIDAWRAIVSTDDAKLKQDFFDGFREVYKDLQRTTNGDLPAFDTLTAQLAVVLRTAMVREVNSTGPGSAPINWSASEYWILVGGAKLDRGFTVEGLTVTYMPRPLATGHADSLQQRARFYGYKQRYLGYCRVYLQSDVRVAFEKYVEHEADIHRSLDGQRGYELKAWARQFILDSSMKPTRKGVIGIPLKEFLASGWIEPAAAHVDASCVTANRDMFSRFREQLKTYPPGTPAQDAHPDLFIDKRLKSEPNVLYEAVPLEVVTQDLLAKLQMGLQSDELERSAAIVALQRLRDEGQTHADVFLIGNGQPQNRSKKKSDNVINQVAQGKSPAGKVDSSLLTYGGDRSFVAPERVSVHLRYFNLLNADTKTTEELDVPWFAVHIPENLEKTFLLQRDGL